jgi:hypothetical protein
MQAEGERRVVERLQAGRQRPRPVVGFLMKIIDAIVREEVFVGTDLMRELLGVHVRQPGTLGALTTPLTMALTSFFADAIRRGEIRADLKPEELTGTFSAMMFGLLLRNIVEDPRFRRPVLKRAIELFARGVSANSTTESRSG